MEAQGDIIASRPPISEVVAAAEAQKRMQGPLVRKETLLENGGKIVREESPVTSPGQITREARINEAGKITEASVSRRSADWQVMRATIKEDGSTEITLDNEEMVMRFGEAEYAYGNRNIANLERPTAPGSITDPHAVRLIYNAEGQLTEVRLRGSFPTVAEGVPKEEVEWQVLRLRPTAEGHTEAAVETWQAQDKTLSEGQRVVETLVHEDNSASLTEQISLGDERISLTAQEGDEGKGTRYQVSCESEQGKPVWTAKFPGRLTDLHSLQESAQEMAPVPAADNINHAMDLLVGKDNTSGQIIVY